MSNILFVILTIIVVMIIMLAIGVGRMEKRVNKKIEEVSLKNEKERGTK